MKPEFLSGSVAESGAITKHPGERQEMLQGTSVTDSTQHKELSTLCPSS